MDGDFTAAVLYEMCNGWRYLCKPKEVNSVKNEQNNRGGMNTKNEQQNKTGNQQNSSNRSNQQNSSNQQSNRK